MAAVRVPLSRRVGQKRDARREISKRHTEQDAEMNPDLRPSLEGRECIPDKPPEGLEPSTC